MKHYGDITKLSGYDLPIVDIITGGSPCQDLSVAGKRAGLAGERSGLFMEQIRVIKEMREHDKRTNPNGSCRPRYMVWENVPGAFSSNKGEDFRAVLEETAKVADENAIIPEPPKGKWTHAGCIVGDGWSIAWRVHDAQFWGVPQRRKRICLLADFEGETAGKILFKLWRETKHRNAEQTVTDFGAEPRSEVQPVGESVLGNTTEGRKEGEGAAGDVGASVAEAGEPILLESNQNHATIQTNGISTSLPASMGMGGGYIPMITYSVGETGKAIGFHLTQDPVSSDELSYACSCGNSKGGQCVNGVVYGISVYDSNAMKSSNPRSGIYEADTSRTLDLNGGSPACNQGGMAVVCLEGNGSRPSHQGDGWHEGDPMYTLNSTEHHAVAVESHAQYARYNIGEVNHPLSANMEHDPANGRLVVAVENHPADSRVKISEDGMVQTLFSRMGTCGGNVPMVMEPVCIGNGQLHQNIDTVAGSLNCMHDQQAVITYGLDRAAYNQGINAQYDFAVDAEKIGTQVAKGPGAVCSPSAIVRRLTPLECERLQGFPVVRKVRFTEMTKDEYIAWNLAEQHIIADVIKGKVYATRGPGGVKLKTPKELSGSNVNGYLAVSICNGDTKMQCRIHRIIWIAAHGIIPDGYVIDHINNDKTDNRLENLQLLTAGENSTKAKADGLYKVHGEAESAKITDEVHDFIQYMYGTTDLTCRQLAEIFGISKSRVHQIIHDEPWTDIGDWVDSKGKKHKGEADSPRYKALGNSIALPFWRWMAKRMVKWCKSDHPTMASLFDGISGFPLSYMEAGCEPVWASEIEEFPIAVTKKRFGEE